MMRARENERRRIPRGGVSNDGGSPPERRRQETPSEWSRSDLAHAAAVLSAALLTRLVCMFALRGDLSIRVPLLDARYYFDLATAIARGGGWPAGPHFLSPIYTFILSGLFRVAPPSIETVQFAQLLFGVATTGLVFLSARRFGRLAGLSAGLLYAFCGPAIVYENQVLLESLLALSLAALPYIVDRKAQVGIPAAACSGLLVGIAGACRPSYLVLLAPILAVTTGMISGSNNRMSRTIAVIAGFLLVVAPPSIHNWKETGRPSLVTVSGGLNLYIGNNPGATGVYSKAPGVYLEGDQTGARSASRMAGRPLDAEGASRFYTRRAASFLFGNPLAAARLWLRKAGFLFGPDEVPQIESVSQLRKDHLSLRLLGPVTFALLLPLAMLGAFSNRRPTRTWGMLLCVLGAGALAHVIFFSTGRYRAALLPAFAVFAGSGFTVLTAGAKEFPRGLARLWPAALAILILLIAPRVNETKTRAWEYQQSGLRFDLIDAPRSAEQMYVRAVEADSNLGEAWHNLAAARVKQGRSAEAIADYERALRHLGENPVTLYNLGVLYGRLGMDEKALSYMDRGVAADPQDPSIRVDRGVALYRLGRKEDALSDWRWVAAKAPGTPSLGRTLGGLAASGVTLPPDLSGFAKTR
jgi:tetratricopeptide (TPR) repeat protein